MERPGTLNPASTPFFPGAFRGESESSGRSMGFQKHGLQDMDRASVSSLSISPSDYRSVKSSPSPPSDYKVHLTSGSEASIWTNENPFGSRTPNDTSNRLPRGFDTPLTKDAYRSTSLETLSDLDKAEVSSIRSAGINGQMTASFFTPSQRSPEGKATPPVAINSGFFNGPKNTSPVSSLDSGSQFTNALDRTAPSFEAQLRSSPAILDILSRIAQCERFTGEIQRDLNEVHRKVNILLERTLDNQPAQPEFKDPFASNKVNGSGFTSPPIGGPRPSIGNIAPNQAVPGDDISAISARLNTLTSSVGQLLAIQTQQIQATKDMRSNSIVGPLGGMGTPGDQTPMGPLSPPAPPNSMIGHGHPQRPEQRMPGRHPGPPIRTWSSGTIDMPIRGSEPNITRPGMMSRDKRQSVTTLLRRDSSGVIDPNGDSLGGTARDGGPMITKWEQLSLAPELLRSLNKFGVGPPNKIQQRALPFLLRGSDIIAQAPPTQERIAAYVIPAIQIAVTHMSNRHANRGPVVVMISTTVDQATQAQRMIRDLGGPIGVKSALGVGATSNNSDLGQELRLLQQNMPHIICGTPQKLHGLFTSPGGLAGSEVRFLVLDEVDQLIARNLHEFVLNIVKLFPTPRSRPQTGTPLSATSSNSLPQIPQEPSNGIVSPIGPQRKFSVAPGTSPIPSETGANANGVERQTALFSNTVPQDVLNLATTIQLREPVRVLVRRDGNVTSTETSQGSRGLRQFYLYLAVTAGGRPEAGLVPGSGHGIIGSGRGTNSAETTQAREWKLDALADLFDDVDVSQVIVHVGGMTSLEAVMYKLATRGMETISLHSDMNTAAKTTALNKFRSGNNMAGRQPASRVLVVYDVQVKPPEVTHVPLIINYDLPKAVEEYAHRVAPAIAHNYSRAGVVINFVTATGGDVEMLRSIECFYKIKCPEVPMSLRDII